MATKSFATPNWIQNLVAEAVGIMPGTAVVRMEDDTRIVFLIHKERAEVVVNKATGKVMIT